MATKRSKTRAADTILVPQTKRAAAARARARPRQAAALPAAGMHFNRRGEIVVMDRALAKRLAKILDSKELIIRLEPTLPPIPRPRPEPNGLCACRGVRLSLVERLARVGRGLGR